MCDLVAVVRILFCCTVAWKNIFVDTIWLNRLSLELSLFLDLKSKHIGTAATWREFIHEQLTWCFLCLFKATW